MSTGILPQYKTYNQVIVTICGDYIVSNINTHGIVTNNCQTHLASLSIVLPHKTDVNNPVTGVTGTIDLIDYGGVVFNKLIQYARDNSSEYNTPYAPIQIDISCYTGEYSYHGVVSKWSVSFTGSVSTISLEWGVYSPVLPTKAQYTKFYNETSDRRFEVDLFGTYRSIDAFLHTAREFFKPCFSGNTSMPKFVYIENGTRIESNFDNYLKFPLADDQTFEINANTIGKSGNLLLNCYNVVARYAVSKNIKIKDDLGCDTNIESPLYGMIADSVDNEYIVTPLSAQLNNTKPDTSSINDSLVFIQNGSIASYHRDNENNIVIPMTSFNLNLSLSDAFIINDIWQNINGTNIISSTGSSISSGNALQAKVNQDHTVPNTSASTIEFECYNVMSFTTGDTGSKIHFKVFDERGNEHPISANDKGYATVMEVSYDLSGAIVKAKVKATKAFGYAQTSLTVGATSTNEGNESNNRVKDYPTTGEE